MKQINTLPSDIQYHISKFIQPEIISASWLGHYCLYDLLYTICDKYEYPHLICDTIYTYYAVRYKHDKFVCKEYYYGENNTLYKHFDLILDYIGSSKRRISWYEPGENTNLDDFINETVQLLSEIPLDTLYYILCNFIYLHNS